MNDPEKFIYRYKYLPFSDGSLETIRSGTIKFSDPADFNDPFDCNPWYDEALIAEHAWNTKKQLINKAAKHLKLSPAQKIMYKPRFIANLRRAIKNDSFSTEMKRGLGMVCLSKNPLNILMWSHYAQNHQGFLLELKIPIYGPAELQKRLNEWLIPFPVIYSNDRPIMQNLGVNGYEEINLLSLTKSADWEYEEEERVIDHIRGPGIHTYKRNETLFSVIGGLRMTPENFKALKQEVAETNKRENLQIKLYKASEIPKKFSLTVESHPRLDMLARAASTARMK